MVLLDNVTLQDIEYKLKRFRRAKYMRIIIHQDGSVVVTAPMRTARREIDKFIRDKAAWIQRGIDVFKKEQPVRTRFTRQHYLKHKEAARKYITERVEHFARLHGYSYNNISIRNQKTCWGSCSSKKNLNFNYRILFLPPEQADYIVVHELCHLKEMNHSARFWKLVEQAIPNYRKIRRELRKSEVSVE